jgi:indole-3-glycerol phosphate synthase
LNRFHGRARRREHYCRNQTGIPVQRRHRPDLDAAERPQYEKGGAAAVSVLTDATFFKGSLDDLKAARSVCNLPVLRKEFIISRYQVYEAAAAGADAILLIARILTPEKLDQLYALCRDLGMDALVEIHTRRMPASLPPAVPAWWASTIAT